MYEYMYIHVYLNDAQNLSERLKWETLENPALCTMFQQN